MARRKWTTRVGWSLKIWGHAELSPGAPKPPKRPTGALRKWLSRGIKSLIVLFLTPGAVSWDGDWITTQRLAAYFGYQPDRVLTTNIGEHRAETLLGGTQIILNTATTIHTRTTPERQEASLETGEILVDSTQDGSRRVRVAAGGVAIDARRAKFSVLRGTDGAYRTRVYDGEVTISPYVYQSGAGQRTGAFVPVRLVRGRSAAIQPGRVVLSRFDAESAPRLLSWTVGMLAFNGETVAEAAMEFNRYNRQQIVITDDSIAHLRVGGTFNATNPEAFARALERTFRIRTISIRSGGRGASVIILSAAVRRASS